MKWDHRVRFRVEHKAAKSLSAPCRVFLTVSLILVSIGVPLGGYGSAEPTAQHWIEQLVRTGQYNLSQSEDEGLYFCSVGEGKVIEVQFERGFVTIIFDSAPPRFFKHTEISKELLRKLTSVRANQLLTVLCVHSFFRDDWQARYDEHRAVNDKLLNIIVVGKKLIPERTNPETSSTHRDPNLAAKKEEL